MKAVDEGKVELYALHAHDHDVKALNAIKAEPGTKERVQAYLTWNRFVTPDKAGGAAPPPARPGPHVLKLFAVAVSPEINFDTLFADVVA